MVQTSHSLRTLHRVVAPYHGLPGKHTALRTHVRRRRADAGQGAGRPRSGGAGDARAERVTELITPIARSRGRVPGAALSAASARRPARHAAGASAGARRLRRRRSTSRSAPSSRARAASPRIASSRTSGTARWRGSPSISGCAPRRWPTGSRSARSGGRSTGGVRRARHAARGGAAGRAGADREPARARGVLASSTTASAALRTWGADPATTPEAPAWDYERAGRAGAPGHRRDPAAARRRARRRPRAPACSSDVSAPASGSTMSCGSGSCMRSRRRTRRGPASVEHLAGMFVPLYLWRAAAFMAQTAAEADAVVAGTTRLALSNVPAAEASARRAAGRPRCEVAMIQEIADALAQSWRNFATAFALFVPRLVAATIIFALGFVVAALARAGGRAAAGLVRLRSAGAADGASEMLRVAEMPSAELLDREDRLLAGLDRVHRLGGGRAAARSRSRGWCRSSSGSCRASWSRCWCSRSGSWSATSSGARRCSRR